MKRMRTCHCTSQYIVKTWKNVDMKTDRASFTYITMLLKPSMLDTKPCIKSLCLIRPPDEVFTKEMKICPGYQYNMLMLEKVRYSLLETQHEYMLSFQDRFSTPQKDSFRATDLAQVTKFRLLPTCSTIRATFASAISAIFACAWSVVVICSHDAA